jgi:hypothetical protein
MEGTMAEIMPVRSACIIFVRGSPIRSPVLKEIMMNRTAWKITTVMMVAQATHIPGLFAIDR